MRRAPRACEGAARGEGVPASDRARVGESPRYKARTARLRGSGAGRRGPRKRPSRGVGRSPTLDEKRIGPAFLTDRRCRTVPRVNPRSVTEREKHGLDRRDERRVVATRQIRAPDRSREQRIADEQVRVGSNRPACPTCRSRSVRHFEAHASWTMPRRVMRSGLDITERKCVVGCVELVDRGGRRVHAKSEHCAVLYGPFVEKQVVAVKVDRDAEHLLGTMNAGDVIYVRVRQQDPVELDVLRRGKRQERVDLVPWIDQNPLARPWTRHDEPILEERSNRRALDYDHRVILAILDDMMFTSKIRTTAKQLGVAVSIARTRDGALADMRAQHPSLVILDLNNPRTDPIGTVIEMKADPALAAIATIGFSHHTQTEAIDAARRAGVGEVLARGAFFERLPDFLTRATSRS